MQDDVAAMLGVALALADIADPITSERFRAGDLRVDTKGDGSPVTDADQRTERALRDALATLRPGDSVVGEEQGGDEFAPARWLLDPIDGTLNYARGVPVWATLIAFVRGERTVCGVVSAPALGRRWWAAIGCGAHMSGGRRLRVSRVDSLARAHLSNTDPRDFARLGSGTAYRRLLDSVASARAFGDFWSHMLVAEGALDIAIEAEVNPWDVAATRVIVEEAGGRFSDFDGASRIDSGNVITSNALLHPAVLRLFEERDPA